MIATESTNDMSLDEMDAEAIEEEYERAMEIYRNHVPQFHPAVDRLKAYPIDALGLSKDTKRELIRKYKYKNLYDLFTDKDIVLHPCLRKKSYTELKKAAAKLIHETDEIIEILPYTLMILLMGNMLPMSDYDKMREDL